MGSSVTSTSSWEVCGESATLNNRRDNDRGINTGECLVIQHVLPLKNMPPKSSTTKATTARGRGSHGGRARGSSAPPLTQETGESFEAALAEVQSGSEGEDDAGRPSSSLPAMIPKLAVTAKRKNTGKTDNSQLMCLRAQESLATPTPSEVSLLPGSSDVSYFFILVPWKDEKGEGTTLRVCKYCE